MNTQATDVSSYLQTVSEDRRPALEQLRQLCRDVLDGYAENMRYGMPSYTRSGAAEPEIAFASQKNYISLYLLNQDVMRANRHLLDGLSVGKGCIRYSRPARIDFEVVKQLLLETRGSSGEIC